MKGCFTHSENFKVYINHIRYLVARTRTIIPSLEKILLHDHDSPEVMRQTQTIIGKPKVITIICFPINMIRWALPISAHELPKERC